MATAAAERLEKVRSIFFLNFTRRAHGSAFISLHGIAARRTGTS
jgi:hypothetical protein